MRLPVESPTKLTQSLRGKCASAQYVTHLLGRPLWAPRFLPALLEVLHTPHGRLLYRGEMTPEFLWRRRHDWIHWRHGS